VERWPHVRAVPQKALLLLSNPPVRRHHDVPPMSANKRMNHLADSARTNGLGDTSRSQLVRARTPWLVEGLRALTGRVSEELNRSLEQTGLLDEPLHKSSHRPLTDGHSISESSGVRLAPATPAR
jgi:hypothetical protein